MNRTPHLRRMMTGILAVSFTVLVAAWGQQAGFQKNDEKAVSDVGQFDKEAAAKAFKKPYSPYVERTYPTRPFFGDTHLHTMYSFDAGAFGCRLNPKDAYRFAKGEEVLSSAGERARLSRPLDFLVVSDHAENLGFFALLLAGDAKVLADPQGRTWYNMIREGKGADAAIQMIGSYSQGTFPKALMSNPRDATYRKAWLDIIEAADEANSPGRFTAFIGYEWTSTTGGYNLHRNVICPRQRLKGQPGAGHVKGNERLTIAVSDYPQPGPNHAT